MIIYFVSLEDTRLLTDIAFGKPFRVINACIGAGLFNEVALSGSLLNLIHRRRSGFQDSDTMLQRIFWLISSSAIAIVMYGVTSEIVICLSPHSFGNLALEINASKGKSLKLNDSEVLKHSSL